MKKISIFYLFTVAMAFITLSSCSKDSTSEADNSLFQGTWVCEDVQGVEWMFTSEGNMYIGNDGFFNYNNSFNY